MQEVGPYLLSAFLTALSNVFKSTTSTCSHKQFGRLSANNLSILLANNNKGCPASLNFIAVALLFAFGIYIYHPVNTTLSKLNDLAYPIIPIFVFCAAGFSFILAVVWYIFTPCCEENRTEKRTIYSIFNIISILVIAIITLLFSLNIPSTLDNNWSKNGTVVYWIQDTYDCCGWYNSTDRPYDNCYILNQGCLSIITPKLTNLYYGIMFSAWGIIAVEIFLIIITWLYYCMYKSFNRDESLYYKL